MSKIKVGIVGARGYTGGELVRLLVNHPNVQISSLVTSSQDNSFIHEIYEDILGETQLNLTTELSGDEQVIFLCLGHGKSMQFLQSVTLAPTVKIIDLGNDFRLAKDANNQIGSFVYGLVELNKPKIKTASYLANPGCFATAIQLSLLPLAKNNLLNHPIHTNATTGSTGAGAKLSETSHFSWRNQNHSPYKTFTHQHLAEITESLKQTQSSFQEEIYFQPYRGAYTRGIFASSYTKYTGTLEQAKQLFADFYKNQQFVQISNKPIHLKQVINTNKCIIHLEKQKGMIIVHAIIDNLLKGASGQAVQNLNLMMGWEENLGLKLKANYF